MCATPLNRRALLLALAGTLLGCTATPAERPAQPLAPRAVADLRAPTPGPGAAAGGPTLALVLGGGGLRGFAHVGVLRALEDAGLRPDIVVGTSAGAVVGAAYASGLNASQVALAARELKLSALLDWTLSRSGLLRGEHIAQWVDEITGHAPLERFPTRFAAVATDLGTQRAVVLDNGPAGRAVQASAAVPGINVPVAYPGGHLVDGGATSLVPVRVARAMGATVVIAVDIYCNEPAADSLNALAVVFRVMQSQSCRLAELEMAEADIVIRPAVGRLELGAADQHERAIEAGNTAARAALSAFTLPRGAQGS
jgi:NTE family protein